MRFEEIKELIEMLDKSKLTKIEIKSGEYELKLQKEHREHFRPIQNIEPKEPQIALRTTQNIVPKEDKESEGDFITSPMVGTFYKCPAPNTPAYVKVGDVVKKGQVVAIIEAMKIMNEIEAEFDCKILSTLCDDGQPLEYGAPLFKVERA